MHTDSHRFSAWPFLFICVRLCASVAFHFSRFGCGRRSRQFFSALCGLSSVHHAMRETRKIDGSREEKTVSQNGGTGMTSSTIVVFSSQAVDLAQQTRFDLLFSKGSDTPWSGFPARCIMSTASPALRNGLPSGTLYRGCRRALLHRGRRWWHDNHSCRRP